MGVYCDCCGKGISPDVIKEGIYVCRKCRADYHKECVIRDESLEAEYDKKKEEEATNWSTEVRKVFWPIE